MIEERRLFKREEINCKVKISSSDNKLNNLEAEVINISPVGIGIITEETALNKETPLEISVEMPEDESIYLKGKVVWLRNTDQGKLRLGIKLDSIEILNITQIIRKYKVIENQKIST